MRKHLVLSVMMMVVVAIFGDFAVTAGAQEYEIEVEELTVLPFEHFSIPSEQVVDGSIYFFGGYHGSFPVVANDGIRRYDLETGQLETLPFTLPFGMGQSGVSAAFVGNSFYLPPGFATGDWGGWGTHKRFLEVDLVNQTAEERYPLPNVSRVWGVGTIAANAKVYFFGGWDGGRRLEISEYDPSSDTLTHVANMVRPRSEVHSVHAQDGWIYYWTIGTAWAYGIERFDPVFGAVEVVVSSGHTWFEAPYVYWYLPDEHAILMLEGWATGMTSQRLIRFDLTSFELEDTGVRLGERLTHQRATRNPDDPSTFYACLLREVPGSDDTKILTRVTLTTPNEPPVADAGPDQWLAANDLCQGEAVLDGSSSFDPDDDPLTYVWTAPGFEAEGELVTALLPLGVTEVELTVDDGRSGVATDQVMITVDDVTPPEIAAVEASPSLLWPPNHTMRRVGVTVAAIDACDPVPTCSITGVTSNEPITGPGSGNTAPDWQLVDALEVELRAERAGSGDGRVYTLEITCTDADGNPITDQVEVAVPHDRS